MSTLEDKILGEKTVNYCSSSEDEEEVAPKQPDEASLNTEKVSSQEPWRGYSRNTGPKGVLRDWELFKEHEKQAQLAKEQELLAMCQKAMTCRTEAEDQRIKDAEEAAADDDLLSDDVLRDFLKKRMDTMLKGQHEVGEFGELEDIISGDAFLKVLDETNEKVTIVVHIYDARSPECGRMNECLSSLTSTYRNVKFCKIRATVAGVSSLFKEEGVPALLVYKGGNLIGNFIRLKEELGSEFYPGDVENFLIENGILQDQCNISTLLKDKCNFSS